MIGRAFIALLALALVAVGCRPAEDADPLQIQPERAAPAAAVAPGADSVGLAGQLARLEAELRAARGSSGDELRDRMTRAEAITDRLLEDEPEIVWLADEYLVEARLRQLQVMADRILARLRRGAGADRVRADIEEFTATVAGLREALGAGGYATAPPPLDSLLRDSAAIRRSPAEALGVSGARVRAASPPTAPQQTRPSLLGTPVDTTPP